MTSKIFILRNVQFSYRQGFNSCWLSEVWSEVKMWSQNEVCISTPSRRIESFIFIVAEQNDLNLIPYLTCNNKTDLIFSLLTQD